MRFIYINKGASRRLFSEYLKKYNNAIPQQAQKYNQLLMEGFVHNGANVYSISTRPLNRVMTNQKYFCKINENENGIDYYYVPFFNVKVLRELSVFCGVFFKILFMKTRKKDSVVICDALNISGTIAALCSSFIRGFRTIGIITDVPCHFSNMENIPLYQKINLAIMQKFKGYLLLTEQMNEIVNPKKRPYVVLEGHSDLSMESVENLLDKKDKKKVCLYAGSLKRVYGIEKLVKGFIKADIPDAELHIYGDGDFRKELEELVKKYKSVKYMGIAPNSEIVEAELKASLLINPRPTDADYTKYSFPSKNMEYMASGTPVLTTRLPGMPKEYDDYVFLIDEENENGICKKLKEIFMLSPQELHDMGLRAKNFVMKEKNNVAQARKLLCMVAKEMKK